MDRSVLDSRNTAIAVTSSVYIRHATPASAHSPRVAVDAVVVMVVVVFMATDVLVCASVRRRPIALLAATRRFRPLDPLGDLPHRPALIACPVPVSPMIVRRRDCLFRFVFTRRRRHGCALPPTRRIRSVVVVVVVANSNCTDVCRDLARSRSTLTGATARLVPRALRRRCHRRSADGLFARG